MMSNNVSRGDIMNENVKFDCSCSIGYDKGALKKTLENNIFTIFGNLNQKNCIIIRYHGLLTENISNNSTTFNMFYYFDNLQNDKKQISLGKCQKCVGEHFCAAIDLENHTSIHFGFTNNNGEYELNNDLPFKLDIAPDPISEFMNRHGFEENTNLPVIETEKETLFIFENILNKIKNFFNNIFKKDIIKA